jgi:hypothetical protein
VKRVLVGILLAALAVPAGAQEKRPAPYGSWEFQAGLYRPNVDSEFTNGAHPWKDSFGTGREWLFRGGWARDVWTGYGSVEVGLQLGYFRQVGSAIDPRTGAPSGDRTSFSMLPTSATLTYRLDAFADRYGVPFAPYGRLALERYNWWITNGSGKTAKSGATNGWSAALGLALLLDFFDQRLAHDFYVDSGILHTYVFAEARWTRVDDFGSKSSWILSDDRTSISGGLLFVY